MKQVSYYPSLDDLFPLDKIPAALGPLKGAIENALSHFYYKDLIYSKTTWGEQAYYRLKVVSYRRMALEVPNTGGLSLVLFPSQEQPNKSELPISLNYSWPLLAYANRLESMTLPTSVIEWFNALFFILDIDKKEFFESIIDFLYDEADSPLDRFIVDLANSSISLSNDPNVDQLEFLLSQFESLDIDIKDWFIDHLISADQDPAKTMKRVLYFFSSWTGIYTQEDLIAFFTPYFEFEIEELDMAIEFPRAWLSPIDANGLIPENPNIRSRLLFDLGGIHFNPKTGLHFLNPASMNFERSEIMSTGFILEASDIQLDLSPNSNLPAAVTDNRPDDFIGIFIGEASIALPPSWLAQTDSTAEIFASNVIIGTGGFSGTLGLRAVTLGGQASELKIKIGSDNGPLLGFEKFALQISKNQFVSSEMKGFIEIPGIKDPAGSPSRLTLEAKILASGLFEISTTGQIHIGNGIWLYPKDNLPILKASILKGSVSEMEFEVAALFKAPSEEGTSGFKELAVSGNLQIGISANGQWHVKSFSVASEVQASWALPGNIQVKSFGVELSYDQIQNSFSAGLSGKISLDTNQAALSFDSELQFRDLNDPLDIIFDASLQMSKTLLYHQVAIEQAELKLSLQTRPNLEGKISLKGSAGLIAKESLTQNWTLEKFHVALKDFESRWQFSSSGFQWLIDKGTIDLPEHFSADPDDSSNSESPAIILSSLNPIELVLQNNQLSISGSFSLSNFGLSFKTENDEEMFTAKLENADVQFNNFDAPFLSGVSGFIRLPLGDKQPLEIGFDDVMWGFNGLPVGTLFLENDLEIDLGGGFEWIIHGDDENDQLQTGLIVEKETNGFKATILASMALQLPVETLSNETGDEITLAAAGKLIIDQRASKPHFEINNLQANGTFHLGGDTGLLIENGEIKASSMENFFDPTPQNPFILNLSGEVVIEDGPRGGLDEARFLFTGQPLPEFDLNGIIIGSGDMQIAGGYIPLMIERLEVQFRQGLSLPEKIYPQNITLIADASVNIKDVLKGSVQDLTLGLDSQGKLVPSIDGLYLEVTGLEMGSFVLGGALYIGGLQDIPDSLVMAGKLGGTMNGTGITALAAFGVEEGLFLPLGAALDVNLGPAGIPLWATGILLTGASGGISFTGSNSDPDDMKSYVQINDQNEVQSTPRPIEEDVEVEPENQVETRSAEHAPEGTALAFPCPDGPCPPPSIGILYEPHPDETNYPDRIIFKYTSLNKAQVDDILESIGLSPTGLQSMTPSAIANQISAAVISIFRQQLPFMDDQLDTIENLLKGVLTQVVQKAMGDSQSVYDALLREAYKGLKAPNMNMKLTGTFSYTGISSFLSITGGAVVSPTVQSAGILGTLNLVGIPVGKFRGFLTLNNEQGLPDPTICGDLSVALGPLELGMMRMNLRYGFDVVEFSNEFASDIQTLSGPLLSVGLRVVSPQKLQENQSDVSLTLSQLTPEEQIGLLGFLMQQDLSQEIKDFLLELFDNLWDNFNPTMLLCGSVHPKIFGLPLGEEVVGVSAMADKKSFSASFRFSPSMILGQLFYNIFPPLDKMDVSFSMPFPDPKALIEAGFGKQVSLGELTEFYEDTLSHALDEGLATLSYDLAPLGLKLLSSEGRLLMPDLLNHPVFPGNNYVRPEKRDGNLPGRREVLIAAVEDEVLGNVFWKGSGTELQSLSSLQSNSQLSQLDLRKDYFPYGGFLGAGKFGLPKILTNPPPFEIIYKLANGSILEKVSAAGTLLEQFFTTQDQGHMAFYLPLPNPPTLSSPSDQSLHQIMQNVMAQGFDLGQLSNSSFYAFEESFFEGRIGSKTKPVTILGIPVGSTEIRLEPPQSGGEGYMTFNADIPTNSWLHKFIDQAEITFKLTQKPDRPIEDKFHDLRLAFRATPNKSDMVAEIFDAVHQDLPKLFLHVSINNLTLPAPLNEIIGLRANVRAEILAYSPYFDYNPNFTSGTPTQTIKNYGGILIKITGGMDIGKDFGLGIQNGRASISLVPKGALFPSLSAEFFAQMVKLPFGLPEMRDVDIDFKTEPGTTLPVLTNDSLKVSGTVTGQKLNLKLTKTPNSLFLNGSVNLNWQIATTIPSIYFPGSNLKLADSFALSTELKSRLKLTLQQNKLPQGQLNHCVFTWQQRPFTLPTIILQKELNTPAKLLAHLKRQFAADPYKLFGVYFKDASSWLAAIKSGKIKLVLKTPDHYAKVFKQFGNSILQTGQLLKQEFNSLEAVLSGLYRSFKDINGVLDTVTKLGYNNASEVIKAFQKTFKGQHLKELISYCHNRWKSSWRQSHRTLTALLKSAGYSMDQIAQGLKPNFNFAQIFEALYFSHTRNLQLVLDVLKQAGFNNYRDYCSVVFKNVGDGGATILVKFLRANWTNWRNPMSTICSTLKSVNFSLKACVSGLLSEFGEAQVTAISNIAKNTYGSGYTQLLQLTAALKSKFGSNAAQLKKITGVLIEVWGNGENEIKLICKALNQNFQNSTTNIFRALEAYLGKSTDGINKIISAAKYTWGSSYNSLKQIALSSKTVFGSQETYLKRITKAICRSFGSSYSNMKLTTKALKYVWGSSEASMKKITKSLKFAWGSSQLENITKSLRLQWATDSNRLVKIINSLIDAFGKSMAQMTKIANALLNSGFTKASIAAAMLSKGWVPRPGW